MDEKQNGLLKAIVWNKDLFIGWSDLETTSKDIENYIMEDLKVMFVKCVEMVPIYKSAKSFKIIVNQIDGEKLLVFDVCLKELFAKQSINARIKNYNIESEIGDLRLVCYECHLEVVCFIFKISLSYNFVEELFLLWKCI